MSELRISATEAFALMRDRSYLYLDVRTKTEFMLGHPQGARNVPWQLDLAPGTPANPDFLPSVRAEFALDAPLIVGCRTHNRSARAAAALRAAGYTNVLEQRGGMAGVRDPFGGVVEPGWEAAGLPIETGEPPK